MSLVATIFLSNCVSSQFKAWEVQDVVVLSRIGSPPRPWSLHPAIPDMASDQLIRNDEAEAIKMDSEESAPGGSSVDEESGELGEGEDLGSGANLPVEQAPKRKGGRKPVCSDSRRQLDCTRCPLPAL